MTRKDHKEQRDAFTIRLPLDVWERVERAAGVWAQKYPGRKYQRPTVYLARLVAAMHPNPALAPGMAVAMPAIIPALLRRGAGFGVDDRQVTLRTPPGVKARVRVAAEDYGCPDMSSYLRALLSALHEEEDIFAANGAAAVVGGLLAGDLTEYFLPETRNELSGPYEIARALIAA